MILDVDRARGALLGLAVGDALGTTCEFEALEAPPFPELATGPVTGIVGGGPFDLKPGQVTDDTQMAVALTAELTGGEALDPESLMTRYAAWSDLCFDIGYQTHAAIHLFRDGVAARSAARRVWEQTTGRKPAGNGSLMRTAPIGVLLAGDADLRREVSLLDASLTHFDPRCQLACVGFNGAVARAVTDGAGPGALIDEAAAELEVGAALMRETYPELGAEIDSARADLAADLEAARRDDPELYGRAMHLHGTQGFVRVAWRLAFWELLHAPSFTSALIDVTNRGGDADTNAAICGALYGAMAGAGAIEPAWIEAVMTAPGLAGDRYHPRDLLAPLGRW